MFTFTHKIIQSHTPKLTWNPHSNLNHPPFPYDPKLEAHAITWCQQAHTLTLSLKDTESFFLKRRFQLLSLASFFDHNTIPNLNPSFTLQSSTLCSFDLISSLSILGFLVPQPNLRSSYLDVRSYYVVVGFWLHFLLIRKVWAFSFGVGDLISLIRVF